MRTDQRSDHLIDYVEDGQICLRTPPAPYRFDITVEYAFIDKINRERTKRGLKPLRPRLQTRAAARFHSLDMATNDFFGHQSPFGRGHADRIAAFDRTLLSAGTAENVAQSGPIVCQDRSGHAVSCTRMSNFVPPDPQNVAESLHQRLMESPGHRRNILHPDMTHIAVGVARTDTGFWVTQLFTSYAGDLSRPVPLSLPADETLGLDAYVADWTMAGFAISKGPRPQDLKSGRLPKAAAGEHQLHVRAEREESTSEAGPGGRLIMWVYMAGPSFIAVPAR